MIASVISAALSALVIRCAPNVGPTTMSAIVTYESGDHPFAIGDNTTRHSYFPTDRPRATELAASLLRAGHDIDVGYAQINASNFRAYGLDIVSALDPCTNIATASRILRVAYSGAARAYGPGERALKYALSAYNTGGYFAGSAYARGVYATAATLRFQVPVRVRSSPIAVVRSQRAVPFYSATSGRVAR